MDETLLRRLLGLATLAIVAFLLSWLLPRPGLQRLQGERVVTMDLTRADSQPEEQLPGAEIETPSPAITPGTTGAVPHPDREPADRWPEDADAAMPPESAEADEAPAVANPAAAPPAPEPKTDTKPETKPDTKIERGAATIPPAQRADPAPPPPRKPEPATPRPAPKPASSPADTGSVLVQAGAYSFLDKAQGVVARAKSGGVSCLVSPAETSRGTLYRVRCGPYSSREEAAAAVKTLAAASITAQVVSGAGR